MILINNSTTLLDDNIITPTLQDDSYWPSWIKINIITQVIDTPILYQETDDLLIYRVNYNSSNSILSFDFADILFELTDSISDLSHLKFYQDVVNNFIYFAIDK